MTSLLLFFHIILCVLLVGAILLQAGKGADIGAVFGGASSQTLFGSRGPASFLAKFTVAVAVLFLITSLSMARLARNVSEKSVIDRAIPQQTEVPAASAPKMEEAAPVPATNDTNKEEPKK